jgi:hypothetical protein
MVPQLKRVSSISHSLAQIYLPIKFFDRSNYGAEISARWNNDRTFVPATVVRTPRKRGRGAIGTAIKERFPI